MMAMTSRESCDVLGFLGVDAQPGIMRMPNWAAPFGLDFGEVAEVIAEALGGAAIEPGPERRLADGDAAALGHAMIVVGDARDHVDVGVDVGWHGGWVPDGQACSNLAPRYGTKSANRSSTLGPGRCDTCVRSARASHAIA